MAQQYIRILRRLLELRKRYRETLNDQGLELLDRCIVAAFRECAAYGALAEARAIISASR